VLDAGVFTIGFSGGEPFLRPDFLDILEYAHKRGLVTSVATNGSLMTQRNTQKIAKLVHRLTISIDGASAEVHDFFRGVPGLFNKVVRSVKLAVQAGIKVNINFTPSRLNYFELYKIIELALELDVFSLTMLRYVPVGRGTKELDLSSSQWEALIKMWHSRSEEFRNDLHFHLQDEGLYPHINNLVDSKQDTERFGCTAGIIHCRITPTGDVKPCAMLPIFLGNLKKEKLETIWAQSDIITTLQDRNKLKGKCGVCRFRYSCGGCRAMAYAYFGDYLAEDPRCTYIP